MEQINKSVMCPFTVAIDTREQVPFLFRTFRADKNHQPKDGPTRYLQIPTETKTLRTGDYSIAGFESEVVVERKSLVDLFGTLGSGRDRFVRELERLAQIRIAHVVIESCWMGILTNPPARARIHPKTIFRSINAWEQEFPTIHWQVMENRKLAEHKTFRILERFWNQKNRELGQTYVTCRTE